MRAETCVEMIRSRESEDDIRTRATGFDFLEKGGETGENVQEADGRTGGG
jgi:hypothetical protein